MATAAAAPDYGKHNGQGLDLETATVETKTLLTAAQRFWRSAAEGGGLFEREARARRIYEVSCNALLDGL